MVSTRDSVSDVWKEPVNLGLPINRPSDSNWMPSISSDGLSLFYAHMPTGRLDYQIVVSTRASIAEPWEALVDLGSEINFGLSQFPGTMSPDGSTLYFTTATGDSLEIWQVAIVPEPSTWLLIISGIAGLVVAMWWRSESPKGRVMPRDSMSLNVFRAGAMLLASVFGAASTTAEQIRIVYPPEFEHVEAPDGGGPEYYETGYRGQLIVPNETFAALPETHHRLIGFNWRPDGVAGRPSTVTVSNAKIYVSTTDADVPSTVYADNYGPDVTLVFDGTLSVSTMNTGPDGGPKDFDIAFPFDQPFNYDPTSGANLLVEMQMVGPWNWVSTDENLGSGGEPYTLAYGSSPSAAVATRLQFSQVPHQFIFVPEPSTLLLAIVGFVGLLVWSRR